MKHEPQGAHFVGNAIGRLVDRLVAAQDELARRETSGGTYHDVSKMNKLRLEIAKLEKRIAQAERLQDSML